MNCLHKIFNKKNSRVTRFVNQKVSADMLRTTYSVKLKENIENIQTRNSPPSMIKV